MNKELKPALEALGKNMPAVIAATSRALLEMKENISGNTFARTAASISSGAEDRSCGCMRAIFQKRGDKMGTFYYGLLFRSGLILSEFCREN